MKVEDINLRPALINKIEDKLDKLIFENFQEEVNGSIDSQKADIENKLGRLSFNVENGILQVTYDDGGDA